MHLCIQFAQEAKYPHWLSLLMPNPKNHFGQKVATPRCHVPRMTKAATLPQSPTHVPPRPRCDNFMQNSYILQANIYQFLFPPPPRSPIFKIALPVLQWASQAGGSDMDGVSVPGLYQNHREIGPFSRRKKNDQTKSLLDRRALPGFQWAGRAGGHRADGQVGVPGVHPNHK